MKQSAYSKSLLTKPVERERGAGGRARQEQERQLYWGSPRCGEKIYSQAVVGITEIDLWHIWSVLHRPHDPKSWKFWAVSGSCALLDHFTVILHTLSSRSKMAFLVAVFPWRNELWQEASYLWTLEERVLNGWRGGMAQLFKPWAMPQEKYFNVGAGAMYDRHWRPCQLLHGSSFGKLGHGKSNFWFKIIRQTPWGSKWRLVITSWS